MAQSSGYASRCPQCGADPGPGAATTGVRICGYCRTVIVHSAGSTEAIGRAVGRWAQGIPAERWTEALTCRLCGAPLPPEVVKDPLRARCDHCGHRARLRPGILSVLRVAATHPSRLPPRTRRAMRFWLAAWIVAVFGAGPLAVIRNDQPVRGGMDLAAGGPAETSLDLPLPDFVSWVTIQVKPARAMPTDTCIDVSATHRDTGASRTAGLRLPARQRYGADARLRRPPSGTYSFRAVTTSLPEPVEITIRASTALSLGYLIFLLNALVWLMFVDVGIHNFRRAPGARPLIARALIVAVVLFVGAVGILRWDPLADRAPHLTFEQSRGPCGSSVDVGADTGRSRGARGQAGRD